MFQSDSQICYFAGSSSNRSVQQPSTLFRFIAEPAEPEPCHRSKKEGWPQRFGALRGRYWCLNTNVTHKSKSNVRPKDTQPLAYFVEQVFRSSIVRKSQKLSATLINFNFVCTLIVSIVSNFPPANTPNVTVLLNFCMFTHLTDKCSFFFILIPCLRPCVFRLSLSPRTCNFMVLFLYWKNLCGYVVKQISGVIVLLFGSVNLPIFIFFSSENGFSANSHINFLSTAKAWTPSHSV
jgi:hypothetical protein